LLMALSALCDKWENFCEGAKANLPKEMTAVVQDAVEAVKAVKDAADKRATPTKKSSTGKAKK
ncbi:MAG: hypothetical protein K8U57_00875, partial [Planctomycetes bacterium]|nr:hypothetical protein [Planctomycetota bacterium]